MLKNVRKQILFSADLAKRIQAMSLDVNEDFSSFVRKAAEERVKKIERERLFLDLAEGYAANADLDRGTCRDFRHADKDTP